MLILWLGEQHYLHSENLVQSCILMTAIGNFKTYSVSRVHIHSISSSSVGLRAVYLLIGWLGAFYLLIC